jgi:peptidoglycan/LPS O-acetylase OafA/YrhL
MTLIEPSGERHRYAVLDSYRFIAALGIVAYHFESHFSIFLPHPSHKLENLQTLVDFFFVLSGFVLMHTYGERIDGVARYGDFLRKRFARVYPLQFATLMLCVLLYAVVTSLRIPVRDPSIIDMHLLLPNLLLVQAWGLTDHPGLNSPSWSISAEAFVYLLFPLFVIVARRLRPALTLGLAVLIVVAVETARRANGLPSGSLATFDFGMIRAVPMFLAGIAVYRIVVTRPLRPMSWLIPHALFGVIVVMMLLKAPAYAIDGLYPLLVALIALAERGGRRTWLASPLVTQLGNASFAIYMIHTFIQIACVGLVRHMGWTSVPALIAVSFAGGAVIVLCGVASSHGFETPMRRWLSGSSRPRGLALCPGGPERLGAARLPAPNRRATKMDSEAGT